MWLECFRKSLMAAFSSSFKGAPFVGRVCVLKPNPGMAWAQSFVCVRGLSGRSSYRRSRRPWQAEPFGSGWLFYSVSAAVRAALDVAMMRPGAGGLNGNRGALL